MQKYCGQSCETRGRCNGLGVCETGAPGRCNDLGVCETGRDPVCMMSPCWSMLMKYDMDNDNTIELPEFQKFLAALDINGDGEIDENEMQKFGDCRCLWPYVADGNTQVRLASAGPKTFHTFAKNGGIDYATLKAICRDHLQSGSWSSGGPLQAPAGLSAEASALSRRA